MAKSSWAACGFCVHFGPRDYDPWEDDVGFYCMGIPHPSPMPLVGECSRFEDPRLAGWWLWVENRRRRRMADRTAELLQLANEIEYRFVPKFRGMDIDTARDWVSRLR